MGSHGGIMETMGEDEFFQWNDVHWRIPKPELNRGTGWNESLEHQCTNKGIVGWEREELMKLHTASPFAPCATPNCDKMETKANEFSRCSICRIVAYWSRACSKEAYSFHKARCIGR
mmetsp:Transcript_20183/g.32719  ORF Transcript_20183/g.32719 Transcript_20183/m.32719 type:complete len:117 (+) Transcript_20183:96-446(+)